MKPTLNPEPSLAANRLLFGVNPFRASAPGIMLKRGQQARTALLLGLCWLLIAAGVTSVSAQDVAGPKVTNQSPALVTSGAGPLNGIRVTFNEAIDVASFTPEDVTLYGPMGGADSGDGQCGSGQWGQAV